MRLAILSDIHGNPLALDAVLADIQSQGEVDAYWVLGDFAALGYDPVTPLEKVTALSHASFTRGNTDRYVVTGDLPVPPEKALEDPALLPQVIEAARSFSWTRGYVSAAGWLDWLTNLPLEVRVTLPDGTRLLGVHASPGRDDGPGMQPRHSDGKLEQRLAGCEADLVIVGHTHVPLDRQVGKIRVINLGSISNPVTSGLQATYVLLDADEHGYSIQLRRVNYDREAVIKAIEQSHHPTPSFLIGFMRGERVTSSDRGEHPIGGVHEQVRERHALGFITGQQLLAGLAFHDGGQLPAKIGRIHQSGVHALTTCGAVEMSGVAKQEDPIAMESTGNAVMDVVGRNPARFRHAHVAVTLHCGTDLLEGEIMPIDEAGRHDPDDSILVLARHGKQAEEALCYPNSGGSG